MKEQLIEFETAKLAKEKGLIGFLTHDYYNMQCELIKNDFCDHNGYPREYSYTAITQSLLQKWLREKHKLIVEVNIEDFNTTLYFSCTIYNECFKYTNGTYEQALEKGLIEALKLIT